MTKQVALITSFSCFAEVHRRTLERLFGDEIVVTHHAYDPGLFAGPLQADLYLVSLYQTYLDLQRFLPPGAKIVILGNTLTEEQYRKVAALPAASSVLLVNFSVETTMDTISMFRRLGLDHLDLVPCYPGVENLPQLTTAVTPGEGRHVPPFVEQVIDIGDRVMDVQTVLAVAAALGLEHLLKEQRFVDYFKAIRMSPDSVTSLFDRTTILESRFSSLLDILDDGIVLVENNGLVIGCNHKAREVLGRDSDCGGLRAVDLVPGIPFRRVLEAGDPVDYTLVKLQGRDVSVKVVPVSAKGSTRGALAIVNLFEEKEKNQHELRSQILGKGHRSRYTFDDLLTCDPAFMEVKEQARKKARSDASVLILGETGTGKELLAHAIHHASRRSGRQFVTVNCAALPESLLESELFGYEEGAFTGARRGGKPGLFELAHMGTIFLDEIGEMDPSLQARLLRVLESGDVMRIGGDRKIYVDTRIIAATNQDLWQRVEEGRFRKDLYYRLNALPVRLPPLRERRTDIPFLLEHLKRTCSADFQLTPGALARLLENHWHGNVRELKNLVDYLTYLDKRIIDAPDLAQVLSPAAARSKGPAVRAAEFGAEGEECRFLLECLHEAHRMKTRMGRRGLHQRARERDLFLTEAQIRTLLDRMEGMGYVKFLGGRGGTAITSAGIEALQ